MYPGGYELIFENFRQTSDGFFTPKSKDAKDKTFIEDFDNTIELFEAIEIDPSRNKLYSSENLEHKTSLSILNEKTDIFGGWNNGQISWDWDESGSWDKVSQQEKVNIQNPSNVEPIEEVSESTTSFPHLLVETARASKEDIEQITEIVNHLLQNDDYIVFGNWSCQWPNKCRNEKGWRILYLRESLETYLKLPPILQHKFFIKPCKECKNESLISSFILYDQLPRNLNNEPTIEIICPHPYYHVETTRSRSEDVNQITEIVNRLLQYDDYIVYGNWSCQWPNSHQGGEFQADRAERRDNISSSPPSYRLDSLQGGECQAGLNDYSNFHFCIMPKFLAFPLTKCRNEVGWQIQYPQKSLETFLKLPPRIQHAFFTKPCEKCKNRSLITSFFLYDQPPRHSNSVPTIEIICHLEWNNHYRVISEWKCEPFSHKWHSSYTWISLRKYLEQTPAVYFSPNDFYKQKCFACKNFCKEKNCVKMRKKCNACKDKRERCFECRDKRRNYTGCKKCDHDGIILNYEPLVRSYLNGTSHKEDICAKCIAGVRCIQTDYFHRTQRERIINY
ncbi:16030_t:CDS:10 [Funneliformis caledonium]|uniref:16030_t:CDS:1 n=1 Tax=Funneliformis caledonium TaxID=1117310 RepID=A0A9N8YNX7_9GLOM|nr:16030_t:CDS:10 [Funneliformis caledonium]